MRGESNVVIHSVINIAYLEMGEKRVVNMNMQIRHLGNPHANAVLDLNLNHRSILRDSVSG